MVLKGAWLAGTTNLSWLAIAPMPVSISTLFCKNQFVVFS
jgi:hypothetical protein